MPPVPFLSRLRILSTSFRYANSRLFIGRADLYFDRIELLGWGPGNSGKRIIPLDDIVRFEQSPSDSGSEVTSIIVRGGERIDVLFRKPDAWARHLKSRLAWRNRLATGPASSSSEKLSLRDLISYSSSMS